jgi:hypothetical protein
MSTAKHVMKKRQSPGVTLTKAQKLLLEWLHASALHLEEAAMEGLTQPQAFLLVLRLFVEDLQVLQQASEGLSEEN